VKTTLNTFTLILTLIVSLNLYAQISNNDKQVSIEKSINGFQTGFLGIWLYNESRLSHTFALRSQIGIDFRLEGVGQFESAGPNDDFYGILHLSLAPRWYYNLKNRFNKAKSVKRNSGNFIELFVVSNFENLSFTNNERISSLDQIKIIPKWGIRRTIGKHFVYEAGIGLGYEYYLNETSRSVGVFGSGSKGNFSADIHLRIGLDL